MLNIMSSSTPSPTATLERLKALRLENYRRTRWAAIDSARKLVPALTWEQIGDALGVLPTAAARFYRQDRPQDQD